MCDDATNTASEDPIEKQSSRVACAVSFAGPTDWQLLSTVRHDHPAYRQLIGYEPGTPAEQLDGAKVKSVSPISFATKDDPPLMQVHGDKDVIAPIEHAKNLHQKLASIGVESELIIIPGGNHGVAGAGDEVSKPALKFATRHLITP